MKTVVEFLKPVKFIVKQLEGNGMTIHQVWPAYYRIIKALDKKVTVSTLVKIMKNAVKMYIEKNIEDFQPTMKHETAVFLSPGLKHLGIATDNE